MLNAIFEAVKVILVEYVFAAEASGKTGTDKKAEVVTAINVIVDMAAIQFRVNALIVAVVKFFLPYLVDAVVAKLNAEGKLNPTLAG